METTVLEAVPTVKTAPRLRSRKEKSVDVPKAKKTLVLSVATIRRLGVQSLMTGKSESEIVAELIDAHLRQFVISDRSRPTLMESAN